ncbi:helix-turn-helix transcriptional regulator [Blastococcus sp. TML/C7B]|uniref:helix-turn-helix transcriptional regulator n=1 Tax=Blastococcus sp. TML/C7B TaxID=2798728 RepID=UPI002816784D|nr:helix-turn-helix transcriptional regulator [Blastococcus sp. TML/C7B]
MNAVRRLRTDRGLSQRRLAAAIGVDPLTVKRLEAGADPGDLPLRVIERLAHTLAAPLQDLLLPQHRAGEDTQLGPAVGAALLAHGRTTVTALATALHATVAEGHRSHRGAELPAARRRDRGLPPPRRRLACPARAHACGRRS